MEMHGAPLYFGYTLCSTNTHIAPLKSQSACAQDLLVLVHGPGCSNWSVCEDL